MTADVIHRTVYVMHAVTGVLSLPTGYVALAARKGSPLHRRSGILFVCTMLAMSTLGAILTLIRHKAPEINVPMALMTFYFVVTALTTVCPVAGWTRRHDVALLCVMLVVALADLAFGVASITHGGMALPLLVLVVMLWWLWRVRYRARGRRLAMQARAA